MTAPRGYRQQPSILWWVGKRSYALFILRELSAVAVAWFVAVTLAFAWSVGAGEEQYQRYLDVAANPVVVAVDVVALLFLLLHTVTWFDLTPKAMPVRVRGRRTPPAAIVAAQWVGFAAVSALVVWLVVG
ncbi:MAG: fumarate reductase subunit C [Streptosporangiales bacterium]|nr:fumarate reductase subunit C [Streptosporangiales bacterium]